MINMKNLILVADELLNDGLITPKERGQLITEDGEVVDNSDFPVDVCENGDVYIHGGTYPLILKGFALLV
jgi:hypothetical protein